MCVDSVKCTTQILHEKKIGLRDPEEEFMKEWAVSCCMGRSKSKKTAKKAFPEQDILR